MSAKDPTPINATTYYPTMQAFTTDCAADTRLTPSAQLLFRILAEQANLSRWTDSFVFTIERIQAITHLSRQTIIEARRILKNLKYIDFVGKPSRYRVYSLVDHKPDSKKPPTPPGIIQETKTKKKIK